MNPALITDPHRSTGPRTESGKATSSRNATKNGLFTSQPYIAEGEHEEYAQTRTDLLAELAPEGLLEQTYATEIVSAAWRLRRCRLVEESLYDEPIDEAALNRARANAHNTLRRSLTELRRLQTERAIRLQFPADPTHPAGVADTRQFLNTVHLQTTERLAARKADGLDSLEALMRQADKALGMKTVSGQTEPPTSSFCKTATPVSNATNATPRNALCPCGSGTKYKRCCGMHAPPVLNMAA